MTCSSADATTSTAATSPPQAPPCPPAGSPCPCTSRPAGPPSSRTPGSPIPLSRHGACRACSASTSARARTGRRSGACWPRPTTPSRPPAGWPRSSERTTTALLEAVGWRGRICRSSGIAARTGRSERLADLTTAVSATAYLCGTGGSRYLDPAPFTAQGLAVQFFTPPSRLASLPPDACRRATALADLAEAGPQALARHLDSHVAAWRNSLHVIPRPGPQGLATGQRAGTATGGRLALTGRPDGKDTA